MSKTVRETMADAGTAPARRGTGRRIVFWSPKGGVGTTTVAVNVAAAVAGHGVDVAYVDLDAAWRDSEQWFPEPAQERSHAGGEGLEERHHPCGLTGYLLGTPTDVRALSRRDAMPHALTVIDVPARLDPTDVRGDALLVALTADPVCVERVDVVLEDLTAAPRSADVVRLVVTTRRESTLTGADIAGLLPVKVAMTLDDEPSLAAWSVRGAFACVVRRSAWAREVRAFATTVAGALTGGSRR